jgi:predicted ribosome quality control (RQC) complex YloA/Tae2 family protein
VAKGLTVVVDSAGHLGTKGSSERFKEAIKPMDTASEAILALKPVTFRYKKSLDPEGAPQFGLVAEDVEKVNPDLVVRDRDGKPYTVRYEAVNAMLLNEFLKEHRRVEELKSTIAKQQASVAQQDRKIQEQEATITQLQKEMGIVVARLKEQDSKIQKVSDYLELRKPAQIVVATER